MTWIRSKVERYAQRTRQRVVDWLFRDVHIHGARFGEQSITLSPVGGPGDVVRWSAARAAQAALDLGMDATGRASTFVGGSARTVPVSTEALWGAVCRVDSVNGSDSLGTRGGWPFATVAAALASASSGDTVLILPGTYNLGSGITIPSGVAVRGISTASVTLQSLNVTADTDLVTMGASTRLEDVTLKLTSTGHYTLRGVVWPGTTTATAKCRTLVLTVDNSSASDAGTSNVYGMDSTGTEQPSIGVQACRALSITVNSAGLGNKRALYVGTASRFSARDCNFTVSRTGAGAGSYIGVETNHANARIDLRLAYVDSPATADVSQTLGTLSMGPVQLANSNANGKGFLTTQQSELLVWADPNALPSNATRYLRPGTGDISNTEIKIRLGAEASVMQNLVLRVAVAPGAGKSDVFTVRKNGVDTALTVTLSDAETTKSLTNVSVGFASGDDISVKVVSANGTATTDVVLTLEVF